MTNLPEKEYKVLDDLQIYRYQPYIERRFENLKTEHAIAPIYLKKKERVVGLLHVYFIAIMVAALLERETRRAMAATKVTDLPLYPEERRCNAPTSPRIFDRFSNVDWYRQTSANGDVVFPVNLSDVQRQVLALLGLPRSLYERFSMA